MATLLIKNGRLIDPILGMDEAGDLYVDQGRISHIRKAPQEADRVVDAQGKWVVPGLIDLHVHFREPGYEYREDIASGALSARAGGFTSVVMMPNTKPPIDNATVVEFVLEKGRAAPVHVFTSGALTRGLKGEALAPLAEMARLGAVAFTDDGESVMNAHVMRAALEYARDLGRPIMSHCEDTHLSAGGQINEGEWSARLGLGGIPHAAEEVMIARDLQLAKLTGGALHIAHVATAGGVELIRRAKADGSSVTAESAPHYFSLTDSACDGFNTQAKMYPPLRTPRDIDAVIAGLADGTLDAIATDHAPHHAREKNVEFDKANRGIIGLETALALTLRLVNAGKIKRLRAIELLTAGPARVLGWKNKGRLAPGADADLTLIDPAIEWTYTADQIRSKSANTPFLGEKFKGRAIQIVVGGKVDGEG